jgi:hypothetical protein
MSPTTAFMIGLGFMFIGVLVLIEITAVIIRASELLFGG